MRGVQSVPQDAVGEAATASSGRERRRRCARALGAAATLALLGAFAGTALAAGAPAVQRAPSGRLQMHKPALRGSASQAPRWACPEGACDAIVVPRPVKVANGTGQRRGLDPQDLQAAYNIPTTLSTPQTIAVVDAFGYPKAEADLKTYRSTYGLPPCTKANGCFKKVNESGEERNYPETEEGWDVEAALDEDMASAACPQCHILLVEGTTELPEDLGQAVNTAASLGATEISNSYGYPEQLKEFCGKKGCAQYNPDYEHPGVLILASAGDSGYGDTYFELGFSTTNFPGSSPNVVAVGGTALFKDEKDPRGWFEEVWNEPFIGAGTGSGCSKFEVKPAWQSGKGCTHRIDNDVAAVAAVVSPVSVRIDGFWELVGGTSVSSPLMAGIMAHASASVRALGAQAFYDDPASLNDVTEGFDWNAFDETGTSECAPNEYLCNAEVGYDGPTGLGTPNGVPGEGGAPAPTVTKISPKTGPEAGGTKVKVTGSEFTSASEVKFGAAPATSITVVSSKSITAQSPAGAGAVDVTVTTAGGTSATGATDRFTYE